MAAPMGDSPWRRTLPALALVVAALLLLYRDTFVAMVGIWSRSDTFAHAFLVPPLALWLMWRRRDHLRTLQPRPLPWMLLPMLAAGAAWLVGDLAGVNSVTQLAATALLVMSVPALAGAAVTRALAFPLAFLFFMVPIGEFVMPQLMQWTADVTVFGLKLIGIQVYREGLQFVIPSGTWSVVEACSGVRYLIASFMVGTLFAYLNYSSTKRRLLFVGVSLVVPIVANWLRAIMIVLLGHYSGNQIATGADHLVYGWVFFGIVIGLMFFIGARWSEAPAEPAAPRRAAAATSPGAAAWGAAAAVALVLGLPHLLDHTLTPPPAAAPRLALPALPGVPQPADAVPLHQPRFEGARAEAVRVYGEGAQAVTVHVAYYRDQTYGHKLVSSQNMLVASEDKAWRRTDAGTRTITVDGRPVVLRTAQLSAGQVSAGSPARRLDVRQVLWSGGHLTASDARAVAWGVAGQLLGRGDDAAAITFYVAEDAERHDPALLDAFVTRHLGSLAAWLDTVRAAR